MRLGDLDALNKEVENLVVGGEKGLKDYYENGSKSDENSWIGGVYDAWELICNAPTVDFEKLGESLRCQIRAEYGSCDDCELSCPRNELIKLLDSVRPQGTWNYEQVAFYGVCSNCGATVTSNLADIFLYEEIGQCPYNTNFCPNCGADMQKGGAE